MKEKAFEELALELASARFWDNGDEFVKTAANLMQKVREATKKEVLKLCDDNFFSKEPKGKLMENIENIPTDRIIIEP